MPDGTPPAWPPQLRVEFAGCPVKASLDVLGRKWALLVLRNIGLYRAQRFNEMLRITPGLTKRVLAMRLKELEAAGFIRVTERGRNYTRWSLTEKGRDALPILMAFVQFGAKWYAAEVFTDRRPRRLTEVFDEAYIRGILKELIAAVPSAPLGEARPPALGVSTRRASRGAAASAAG